MVLCGAICRWVTTGVSEWGGLSLSFLSPPWFSQARAAYFKVGVILSHDVLGARLVLAVPHVDVQLPLMFNEELCQSVLLLDALFQFTQENTKGGWR